MSPTRSMCRSGPTSSTPSAPTGAGVGVFMEGITQDLRLAADLRRAEVNEGCRGEDDAWMGIDLDHTIAIGRVAIAFGNLQMLARRLGGWR
jgi:hypothetical protein